MHYINNLITIIIPIYNKIHYVKNILTDVQNQSFTGFECILVDDGSTDGSEVICDQFVEADRRFRVLHIPNGGVSHARNTGIDQAQGTYITFLDADDRIPALLKAVQIWLSVESKRYGAQQTGSRTLHPLIMA